MRVRYCGAHLAFHIGIRTAPPAQRAEPKMDSRTREAHRSMFIERPHLGLLAPPAPWAETAILVLSMDGRVLHANEQARDIAPLLTGDSPPLEISPVESLRDPLLDLFYDILSNLEKHIAAEDWNSFERARIIHWEAGLIHLRGVGIPDQARRQQSRIILTLHHQADLLPLSPSACDTQAPEHVARLEGLST